MIKNNESKVEITTKNIKYYNKKNYTCNIGDIITIDIDTMPKMSHNKVIAICEKCNSEIELPFSKYNTNKDRQGYYSCSKCSGMKRKKSMLDKYGVESCGQLDYVKEHNKKWMSSDEFKNKSKKSLVEHYGVDSYSKTDEFKSDFSIKMKQIIKEQKENGTYNCPLSNEINKELKEKGMLDKYGERYPFNVPEIKEKIQNSNIEKYGHISPFGNKSISNKVKNTFLEKYGVDNPFKNEKIQEIIKRKNDEKYNSIDIKKFKEYRKITRLYTNRNKKELFNKWDGYDYYDGEYIKDFLIEDSNSKNYPTIDHKTSCLYGFKNNIHPREISEINNLCITKRSINSQKSHINESQFIEIIKQTSLERV